MIVKTIHVCMSRHRPDATCKKSFTPPRCNGCKVDCSKYDRLMLSGVQCQARKLAETAVEIE
jgi:hypothetical protein